MNRTYEVVSHLKDLSGLTNLFTLKQVAEFFGVSDKTIRRLISNRVLESIKVGNSVRISRQALEKFVDQAQQN